MLFRSRYEGSIHPVILAVCHELGVQEVYRIGGVQAIGALACGTQSIAKVDMIVGPGNSWVQAAKKNVAIALIPKARPRRTLQPPRTNPARATARYFTSRCGLRDQSFPRNVRTRRMG